MSVAKQPPAQPEALIKLRKYTEKQAREATDKFRLGMSAMAISFAELKIRKAHEALTNPETGEKYTSWEEYCRVEFKNAISPSYGKELSRIGEVRLYEREMAKDGTPSLPSCTIRPGFPPLVGTTQMPRL